MESSIKIQIPPDFYCPISGELMKDPVSDKTHTYERSEILKWLERERTSPITRVSLNPGDLKPNPTLKRAIDGIRDQVSKEQLKVQSLISEKQLVEYTQVLGDIELNTYYFDNNLFINILTPDIEKRQPVDLVLCIDISFSMSDEATIKGDSNETLGHGFSILSLTVTAAKSILRNLNDEDNISIVTYSREAEVLFDHLSCTETNKGIIETELDKLKPTLNTNMWDGIHQSLDILRTKSPPQRVKGILLLTDGIPNVEPPRGHENTLRKYFNDYEFQCMVMCYGFGYSLNSELLLNISSISGGDGYSFIPDASLLGNIFIHGISNLLTTASYKSLLSINLKNGVRLADSSTNMEIDINSLKYGKEKNIVIGINTSGASNQSIDHIKNSVEVKLNVQGKEFESTLFETPPANYFHEQLYRTKSIKVINECIQSAKYGGNCKEILDELIRDMRMNCNGSQYIENILFDLDGQVKEALNMTLQGQQEGWFSKWGIHYLRSLKDAYQNEICNNFKDKGVSNFASGLFNRIREDVSNIFDKLPPPKQDIQHQPMSQGVVNRVRPQTPPRSMQVYNNPGGGCCAEGSRVLMYDSTYKKVEDLKKGDKVQTYYLSKNGRGGFSEKYTDCTIECIVKTLCKDNKESMVRLNNRLKITPYHPVIDWKGYEKHWNFPILKGHPEVMRCDAIYTIVTKNRWSVIVEGFIFATLGHNITGDVIGHNYFGTDRVIKDLKNIESYDTGLVTLTKDMFKREDGQVYEIS
tara:strand:- start:44 stop:2305 length:2262 start_codon:yes stop_codon:yes gene_type:complete